MKLYLITTYVRGYDCYRGHVIAAETEHDVRLLAIDEAADEGVKAWDTEHATCEVIAEATSQPKGIILSDFNAG
jgi:hypothetical protein